MRNIFLKNHTRNAVEIVVIYAATSHTAKLKFKEIKKEISKKFFILQKIKLSSSKSKKTLICPEIELSSLIFSLYFRKELSKLAKLKKPTMKKWNKPKR